MARSIPINWSAQFSNRVVARYPKLQGDQADQNELLVWADGRATFLMPAQEEQLDTLVVRRQSTQANNIPKYSDYGVDNVPTHNRRFQWKEASDADNCSKLPTIGFLLLQAA